MTEGKDLDDCINCGHYHPGGKCTTIVGFWAMGDMVYHCNCKEFKREE